MPLLNVTDSQSARRLSASSAAWSGSDGLSLSPVTIWNRLIKIREAEGPEARKALHYQLATGSQLDDALAGLAFLKTVRGVDRTRILVVGHSFWGMLTLLSGERDSTIRAEVSFAARAISWRASQELRQRTLASVDKTSATIMLVFAANDFDTTAGSEISAELDRVHKQHLPRAIVIFWSGWVWIKAPIGRQCTRSSKRCPH